MLILAFSRELAALDRKLDDTWGRKSRAKRVNRRLHNDQPIQEPYEQMPVIDAESVSTENTFLKRCPIYTGTQLFDEALRNWKPSTWGHLLGGQEKRFR